MITLDKMFQILIDLDLGTSVVLHKDPDQSWGFIGWFRLSDGTVIDYPEDDLISTLQSLGLLIAEDVVLKNQEMAIGFILTDKSRRILNARRERNPTHNVPYLGEYGWLVTYEHPEGKEVYPYIGELPPDISRLMEEGWKPTGYLDSFSVRCYPSNSGPDFAKLPA